MQARKANRSPLAAARVRRIAFGIVALLVGLFAPGFASAQQVEIMEAWARDTAGRRDRGGVFEDREHRRGRQTRGSA